MSKHLTDLAAIQDAEGFRTAFEDALSDKVASALEDRKVHVAQNFFTDVNHIQNEAFRDEKEIADKVGKTNINVAYRKALANGPRILDKRAHDEVKSAESDADTVAKLVKKTPVSKFVSSRKGDGKVRTEEVQQVFEGDAEDETFGKKFIKKNTQHAADIDYAGSTKEMKARIAKVPTKHLQHLHDYDMGHQFDDPGHPAIRHIRAELKSRAGAKLRNEEVEQIDELSKGTLGSYVKKAAKDVEKKTYWKDRFDNIANMGTGPLRYDRKMSTKRQKEIDSRHKNIGKAVDRLAKEEVEQIDEISQLKLANYVAKAATSLHNNAKEAGQYDDKENANKAFKRYLGIKSAAVRLRGRGELPGKESAIGAYPKMKYKTEEVEVSERTMEPEEMDKREKIVKGMKKSVEGFRKRYGSRAKEVMYATATKLAKD